MSSRGLKREERTALLAKSKNRNRIAEYQQADSDDADDALYDEVDEREYGALRRHGMIDTFVVDDDGGGYADYGQDDNGSDPDADDDDRASGRGGKRKRKRPSPNEANPLMSMFSKSKLKPKKLVSAGGMSTVSASDAPEKDNDFMAGIFDGLDQEVASHQQLTQSKKPKIAPPPVVPATAAPAAAHPSWLTADADADAAAASQTFDDNATGQLDIDVYGENDEAALSGDMNTGVDSQPHTAPHRHAGKEPNDDDDDDDDDDQDRPTSGIAVKQLSHGRRPTSAAARRIGIQLSAAITRESPASAASGRSRSSGDPPSTSASPSKERASAAAAAGISDGWDSVKTQFVGTPTTPNPTTAAPMLLDRVDSGVTLGASHYTPAYMAEHVFESDGALYFYWLDLIEVASVLYMFGKVWSRESQSYASCCLQIKGMQRNVFLLFRDKLQPATTADAATDEDEQPQEAVTMAHVFSEFNQLRKPHKIGEFKSKVVDRKYAFETAGIPAQGQYLKVVYPFTDPALPMDLQGKSFSHAFGTTTSAVELFLRKRRLMGPQWLKIAGAQTRTSAPISWCKMEVEIASPKQVVLVRGDMDKTPFAAPPPLTVMALSIRTVTNPAKHVKEVVAVAAHLYDHVPLDAPFDPRHPRSRPQRVISLRQLGSAPWPLHFEQALKSNELGPTVLLGNEMGLLSFLMAKIHRADPDVIVGHNYIDFDLDVLLHRMQTLKLDQWSKLGRLRRTRWPKLQSGGAGMGDSTAAERQVSAGRIMCDTYRAAQEHIRAKQYSLTYLAQTELKLARQDIDFEATASYFESSEKLLHMLKHAEYDCFLTFSLMNKLQILPLTRQLTNLAGNLWSRTVAGARSERNEYLLLHEFHNRKYLVPDRAPFGSKEASLVRTDEAGADAGNANANAGKGRRKPAYAGGLVLEPRKGFYDRYVLVLDFNSLYPSIIQEFNICFTTVQRDENTTCPDVPDSAAERGVLPMVLESLVRRRREVKQLMKEDGLSQDKYMQYDIRQKAIKLTANSMYGCLGFSMSRFYAKPLAVLITSKGREILQNTVDLAGQNGFDVIYGDTDSIMIHTNTFNYAEVKKMGMELQKLVNKRYKLLEIETDAIFQRMLLLKKKKYAALKVTNDRGPTIETVLEMKGLDLVRRDWCQLSIETSTYVLNKLFLMESSASDAPKRGTSASPPPNGESGEAAAVETDDALQAIHAYLTHVGEAVREGRTPITKFIIYKNLTKNPNEYPDQKSQPHVQVALRAVSRGKQMRAGDTVPYIVCKQESPDVPGLAGRAWHPDDVMKPGSGLDVDTEWYLSTQVHPPVARLCGVIEGTDSALLAECMGLDPQKYQKHGGAGGTGGGDALGWGGESGFVLRSQLSDEERFRDAEPWQVVCFGCQTATPFRGLASYDAEAQKIVDGLLCGHCGAPHVVASLSVQLTMAIRAHIARWSSRELVCDDRVCQTITKQMSVYGRRCLVPGCRGVMAYRYTDRQLATQLHYYASLLDPARCRAAAKTATMDADARLQINRLLDTYEAQPALVAPMKQVVDRFIAVNAREQVDLGHLAKLGLWGSSAASLMLAGPNES